MEDPAEEAPIAIPPPLKSHLEDDCFWIVRRNRLVQLPRTPSVEDILRGYYFHCSASVTEENNLSLLAEVLDGIKIYFDFMVADHLLYSQERAQYKNVILEGVQLQTGQHVDATDNDSGGVVDGSRVNRSDGNGVEVAENDAGSTKAEAAGQSPVLVNHVAAIPRQRPPDPSSIYGVEHLLRLFVRLPFFLSHVQLPNAHLQTLHIYFRDLLGYICSQRQELFSEDHYYEDPPTALEDPGPS